MTSANNFIASIIGNALESSYKGAYKIYLARTPVVWLVRTLLAPICDVNVYDLFMITVGFIAHSIAIVTDLIKLRNRYVLFVAKLVHFIITICLNMEYWFYYRVIIVKSTVYLNDHIISLWLYRHTDIQFYLLLILTTIVYSYVMVEFSLTFCKL